MPDDKILIGCGVLEKEIRFLINKNGWEVETAFLDSVLHTDYGRLYNAIDYRIKRHSGKKMILCYGCCHPSIDDFTEAGDVVRLPVQNCVEMVLGKEKFAVRSAERAFFLYEDWAVGWERVVRKLFGAETGLIREIFQSEHAYLLALRTPCCEDFRVEAEMIAQQTGLPLKWIDTELDIFERHIQEALESIQ